MSKKNCCSALNYWTQPFNYFCSDLDCLSPKISIDGRASANPEVERQIVDEKASYGRQLGWILEAVQLVVKKMDEKNMLELSGGERDIINRLAILDTMIRDVKRSAKR